MIEHSKKSREEIIQEIRDYSEQQFDKLIVYLNSGALVLTIGFVKDIVKITEETDTKLLVYAWSSFVVSLVLILLSHRSSIISMNFEIKKKEKTSDGFDVVTYILNWASFIVFILGISLFITFIHKNL
jgi:hypothetical protein